MIEVTIKKNEYKHEIADCPFCDKWVYIREERFKGQEKIRDMYRHMTNEAKNEAMLVYLGELKEEDAKHLKFYKDNTTNIALKLSTRRYRRLAIQ